MDIRNLIRLTREHLRILENYYIPQEERVSKVQQFLDTVIEFEYGQEIELEREHEEVFFTLCEDIVRQAQDFQGVVRPTLSEAKRLLRLILSIERYLSDIERLPWILGRKVTGREKRNIRNIFRRVLHLAYDPNSRRAVRGTKVVVKITGSLATGASDWKLVNGGNVPKPVDADLPRELKKAIDSQLQLPQELKPLMSDVDILIVNEVIYGSILRDFARTSWSYKLGEKYPTGVGASEIIKQIHQKLLGTSIAGIRGRWANFIVLKDLSGYLKYMENRRIQITKIEKKVGKEIMIRDVLILDEIVH